MGSRHQNSNSTEKEEGDDGGVSGAAVGVTAVAGAAALVVWGLSKLFGSSKPEENNNMLMGSTALEGGYDDDKWTKPKYDWFKLNTDASGGLIRDHRGEWMIGFTAKLETSDITLAELHAVREGLKLALEEGLTKVIIETDSEQAVDLIKNPNKVNPRNISLRSKIEECRSLMMKHSDWELFHICREKNRCADAMAKMAKNQMEQLIIWEQTPTNLHIQNLLSADII
ncbi:hypothetical protein ACJIZ3_020028 [Penstemon smallii]|uniref:RNase H type-1 domain-containing protein n=1 Tax=Penstemon smallii TaxID=265156 RepID=A0ABD3SHF1_9LAMI